MESGSTSIPVAHPQSFDGAAPARSPLTRPAPGVIYSSGRCSPRISGVAQTPS